MLLLSRSGLARRQPRRTCCWDPPPYYHRIVGRPRALPGPRANFVECYCRSSTHSRDHGAASSSALSGCVELGPCGPPQHGCFAPSAPLMTPCAGAVDIVRTAWRMHLLLRKHASGLDLYGPARAPRTCCCLDRTSLVTKRPGTQTALQTCCWERPPYSHPIVGRPRAFQGPRANFVECHCRPNTLSRDHGAASSSALSCRVGLGA